MGELMETLSEQIAWDRWIDHDLPVDRLIQQNPNRYINLLINHVQQLEARVAELEGCNG